jgi:hypothetical protein
MEKKSQRVATGSTGFFLPLFFIQPESRINPLSRVGSGFKTMKNSTKLMAIELLLMVKEVGTQKLYSYNKLLIQHYNKTKLS